MEHNPENNALKLEISQLNQLLSSYDQQINPLKLKSSMPQTGQTNKNVNQNNTGKKKAKFSKDEKGFCYDCGKPNVVKGHNGCQNSGLALFLSESLKRRESVNVTTNEMPTNGPFKVTQADIAAEDKEVNGKK